MSATFPLDLAQYRENLREAEANRRDLRRRGLFWDAEDWQHTFNAIVSLEQDDDTEFQQHLDDARAARKLDKVLALQRQYFYAIEEDIGWYKARETELRVLRERWEVDQAVEATAVDELVSHHDQIVYRLRERRAQLWQIAIEILEERRSQGRVRWGTWSSYWDKLRAAFRAQDAAYRQAFAQQMPRSIYGKRLQWCYALRARQRATARALWNSRDFDREGLNAAAALVDELIDELRPARRRWFDIGAQAKLALVAVVIGVFLFLVLNNGGANGRKLVQSVDSPRADLSGPGIDVPPDPRALDDEGLKLLQQGLYHDALRLFEQAAAADPSWHRPLNNMAFCLYELGLPDEAIAKWRAAINLNSAGQDAYAGLGMALYKAGRYDEALATYRRAIELGGNYLDEAWMRQERLWSDKAITDSRPLRVALEQ
jgi:tetratricopeptide (TPR) repeat protein